MDVVETDAKMDSCVSTACAHATCVIPTVRTTDCVDPIMGHRRPTVSVLLRRVALVSALTKIDTRAAMPECEDAEAQMVRLEDVLLGMLVSRIIATVEWAALR